MSPGRSMVRGAGPRALVAALLVATLAGCVSPTALPDGPSQAELDLSGRKQSDEAWAMSGLAGVQSRPAVEVVAEVARDDWARVIASCMKHAGFEQYRANSGMLLSREVPAELANEHSLALYVCRAQYPLETSRQRLLSSAELDYVYDYYLRFLVPCLGFHGFLVDDVPTREAFLTAGGTGWWTPYSSGQPVTRRVDLTGLDSACPAFPPGIDP
jgi:hypothetical protein